MHRIQQQPFLHQLIGFIAVPLLLILPYSACDPIHYNYTGLINHPGWSGLFFLCAAPCIVWFFYLLLKCGLSLYPKKIWISACMILLFLTLLCIFIPYHSREDFSSGLHVLIGFLAFLYLNGMLIFTLFLNHTLYGIYLAGTFLAWFITLSFASVNGLAEWIYASVLSITLTQFTKPQSDP